MSEPNENGQDLRAGVRAEPHLSTAESLIRELDAWTLERQVELTAIPAPPFGEADRALRMAELFREVGLSAVRTDEEGNVLGALGSGMERPGEPASGPGSPGDPAPSSSAPLILSAHLDTVFPAGTDTNPVRDGDVIRAPGISDDGRGLACLLTLARVVMELGLPLPFPLLFAATVGEEGAGNLRGVRHLFREGGKGRGGRGFVSLDGVGLDRIITRGVGSIRLRVEVEGPGGHSWADWGRPNPIHLLAKIVSEAKALPGDLDDKGALTVARWGGGTSINAIPQEAWFEVDMRGETLSALASLDRGLRAIAEKALSAETARQEIRGAPLPKLELRIRELGRRPAGATSPEAALVRAARDATRILGKEPLLLASSTDANIPMSLGLPAITIGGGGNAGGTHTLGEWYRNDEGPEGVLRALLTVMLLES